MSLKQDYQQLLSLTQLFLLREHSLKETINLSPSLRAKSPLPSLPQQSLPPIPPKSLPPNPPTPQPLPPNPPVQPIPPPEQQPPPITQNKSSKIKTIALEPLKGSNFTFDYRELWKLCQELFPDLTLSESIPSDLTAQKHKNAWSQELPPVILLSFKMEEKHLVFLKNIAQAISLHFAPARVLSTDKLEKENSWEQVLTSSQLRLVIANDYDLYLHPKLMHYYREIPQQGKHFLNQTPLLLLSNLSLYLKEPQLKSLLWRAICNEFMTPLPR